MALDGGVADFREVVVAKNVERGERVKDTLDDMHGCDGCNGVRGSGGGLPLVVNE